MNQENDNDPAAAAVQVLTALARQTRVRGAGTAAETTEPIDFAEVAAHLLAAVAANIGSVEQLLEGRPDSWEADLVRQLVEHTAGGDLVRWRTDPLRLNLDVESVFLDFGISDLYEEELDKAVDRTFEGSDDEREAAENMAAEITRLWTQDKQAYVEAYRATAQRYLTELGATCGLEIVIEPAEPTQGPGWWGSLAEQVHEHALKHTLLPQTGAAPDWTQGTPGAALRRAVAPVTYSARAAAGSPK